jgi:hypothetical protein
MRALPADVNAGVNAECLRLVWMVIARHLDANTRTMIKDDVFTVRLLDVLIHSSCVSDERLDRFHRTAASVHENRQISQRCQKIRRYALENIRQNDEMCV